MDHSFALKIDTMKKIRIHYLFKVFFLFVAFSSQGQDTVQTVKISNLEGVAGDLYVGWYNDATTFRVNEKAIYRSKVEVQNQSEVIVQFKNIPKGEYAIAVFLDENNNYELDRNFFGIPLEKYGFSNNILPAFRPATFEESSFELDLVKIIIDIKLK
jgi:uncharacterized protein (DUF2141 family)